MKGVKGILGVAVAAALIYVVYLIIKRGKPVPVIGVTDGNDVVIDEATTSTDVGCSSSCCQNPCATIDKENPAANYGCCGAAVQALQMEINNMAGAGFNLSPDGAYGPNTQAAHQQVLNANNGYWPEFVGPTMPTDL